MRKLLSFILFIGLVAFLYTYCPDESAHVEALADELPELLNEKLNEIGLDNGTADLGTNQAVQDVIKTLAPRLVDVDNYILFSIGREMMSGENNVVSFGIGGHVFTFNDEIVQKAIGFAKDFEAKVKETAANHQK
mgnify:CR=1 FL=1